MQILKTENVWTANRVMFTAAERKLQGGTLEKSLFQSVRLMVNTGSVRGEAKPEN